jgi:hypothetical protein
MKPMTEEEIKRLNIGSYLLNAKIELSKAILLMDELYEDGYADLFERGILYNLKNELRDYIENYRMQSKEEKHE